MDIIDKIIDKGNENDLYGTLGIHVEEAGKGEATAFLEPPVNVCWPFPERPHGGILFTLMDTTMAWAVFSLLDPGYNCATINMDIQYILPAKGEKFFCTAKTTHQTGHLSFVRAEIKDGDGQILTIGQAVFRIIEMDLDGFRASG